jgi:hypothetical protein
MRTEPKQWRAKGHFAKGPAEVPFVSRWQVLPSIATSYAWGIRIVEFGVSIMTPRKAIDTNLRIWLWKANNAKINSFYEERTNTNARA